ncbi:putative PAS domain S-box [Megalodesulfovibrio gigas DSM 1382 = ATCC 19364]|uniref:histidine kinase n=1 Tax=Megalodesulfovibrio gigas (strain ATCC 19364 / DSM 1382 / NCIMB 9332 / VKM B-1759) TaxID=1121448 RepID=T2G8M9_MEGG1|nr:putative PAS domain S-box [Megalodesulfovibrio gigas DSM 1382 = ATCC 19364]
MAIRAARFFVRHVPICLLLAALLLTATPCPAGGGREAGPYDLAPPAVPLTAEETAWLQAHPILRIGGPRAFPPFHFYDETGSAQGMALDYLHLIAKSLGLTLQQEPVAPWPETLERIKEQSLDLIPCIARSQERESFLVFSKAYLSFPIVIISRRDARFIGGLDDLRGMNVALIPDNIVGTWLKRDNIDVNLVPVGSPQEALEAVAEGAADAAIENLAAASYLIDKYGLANLKVAAPTSYGNYDLHFAVRQDWPELVGILNKALDALTWRHHAQLRGKWLSVRYEHGITPLDVFTLLLVICLPVLAVMGTTLWHNRRLRQEVAHRKRMQAQLHRERVFTNAVLDSVPGLLFLYDDHQRLVRWNRMHETLTGYTGQELASMHLMDWYEGDLAMQEKIAAAVRRVFAQGIGNEEAEIRTKDGRRVPFFLTAVRLDIDGATYFTGIGIDITEHRRMEHALLEAKEDLELRVAERTRELREANLKLLQLDELKSSFISLVSHELRTPLTSVLGYAKVTSKAFRKHFKPLVQDDAPLTVRGDQILDNLQVIESEGGRLSRLINDLLDLNRIESGRQPWHDRPVNLAEEARAAVRVLQREFSEKPQLRVEVAMHPEAPLVMADCDRIRQVFINLLSNALKFSAEGFIRVTVGPDASGQGVTVTVQDSGIGIPGEDLERIFDRFYQVAKNQDTDKASGTGLGLAISRQIVEHYGGRMWAESSPGQGASFTFVLPRYARFEG